MTTRLCPRNLTVAGRMGMRTTASVVFEPAGILVEINGAAFYIDSATGPTEPNGSFLQPDAGLSASICIGCLSPGAALRTLPRHSILGGLARSSPMASEYQKM